MSNTRPFYLALFCCWLPSVVLSGAETPPSEPLQLEKVFLKLIEQVECSASEAGVLTEVPVRPGQTVTAGALLGRLDDGEARLAVERATLLVEQARRAAANDTRVRLARKQLAAAELELQRGKDSQNRFSRSVSETELDRLRLAAETARLNLEQAEVEFAEAGYRVNLRESELSAAQLGLERRRVAAPRAGTVVEVMRRGGEWVEPGQPIARLIDLSRLSAEGRVEATVGTQALVGRKVTFQIRLDDQQTIRAAGKVTFVSPEIDPYVGQVTLRAEIENPQQLLRPGLAGSMVVQP